MAASDEVTPGSREAVAMRCTKGTLPSPTGSAGPSAVGPRITRDLVMTTATPPTGTPRPLSETGAPAGTEADRAPPGRHGQLLGSLAVTSRSSQPAW